jgi:hypothetical protein
MRERGSCGMNLLNFLNKLCQVLEHQKNEQLAEHLEKLRNNQEEGESAVEMLASEMINT